MMDGGGDQGLVTSPDNTGDDQTQAVSFAFSAKLPIIVEPESVRSEAIRSLRGMLIARHLQDGRRSLSICAPSAGNGCSFLAANLAVAMAQVGVNTLLIDANLRNPSIQDYITPSGPVAGLSECLRDDTMPLGQAIQAVHPSLSVLYAGASDPFTPDRIGSNAMKTLMSHCLRDYELTIVDSPPANRFADARRIASLTHYAFVVACRERTYVKDIRALISELESDRTKVVGTYLNDY